MIRTLKWKRVGGEAALREMLPNEWLTTYTGGLVVQAGDKPLLGDLEQGLNVPAYRQTAH